MEKAYKGKKWWKLRQIQTLDTGVLKSKRVEKIVLHHTQGTT